MIGIAECKYANHSARTTERARCFAPALKHRYTDSDDKPSSIGKGALPPLPYHQPPLLPPLSPRRRPPRPTPAAATAPPPPPPLHRHRHRHRRRRRIRHRRVKVTAVASCRHRRPGPNRCHRSSPVPRPSQVPHRADGRRAPQRQPGLSGPVYMSKRKWDVSSPTLRYFVVLDDRLYMSK